MGQAQSFTAADTRQIPPPSTTTTTGEPPPPPPPSMEALVSEAMAFGEDGSDESPDAKVQKALECPCVAALRSGPCGAQFTEAFACFLRSTAEEKGSDCVSPFIALQNCIKTNPNAFSKDVLEEEEEDNESGKEDKKMSKYRIKAPSWSRETRSKIAEVLEFKDKGLKKTYATAAFSLGLSHYQIIRICDQSLRPWMRIMESITQEK